MKPATLFITIITALIVLTPAGCSNTGMKRAGMAESDTSGVILLNQVGYYPEAQKIALIRSNEESFEIIDTKTGRSVFRGATVDPKYWQFSGDTVRNADFSLLREPGTYRLCLQGSGVCSGNFSIGNDVYTEITKAAVKAFYFNRAGFEITPEYGSKWARPAGHYDTMVIVHESAASRTRPANMIIASPGGWYDAGDYNKYIVNSSISVYTLLLSYQMYPEYWRRTSLNIPESDNNIPDLVDELLYNLRWMLTMQDPSDGGVYHKLTNKDFCGFVMPQEAKGPRYVIQKSTAAALDFAAVTAMASRVFANDASEELKTMSLVCATASERAMKWAEEHPDIIYKQPKDISTGTYGDSNITDELFWAKTEMALARGTVPDPELLTGFRAVTPSWNQVDMLGVISLALSEDPDFSTVKEQAAGVVIEFADRLTEIAHSSPYRISLDFFNWGSTSDVANQALLKIIAMKLTDDNKYLPVIHDEVDYLLGRNATGYCFVTGYGYMSPMNIHHRPSGADGVPEPVPGFLVGGPNTNVLNDCGPFVRRSSFPAKSYIDNECSYSTNEICINWNAPLVFVLGAIEAGR